MTTQNRYSEKLFSYGTLQYENVQLSTFGRKLEGNPDILPKYLLSTLEITDPKVISLSGQAVHSILRYSGNEADEIKGTLFHLTPDELKAADSYEVAEYKRVRAQLRSGNLVWIYVSTDSQDPVLS